MKKNLSKKIPIIFGMIFAFYIFLLLNLQEIFLRLHKFDDFCYVTPTKTSIILSYIVLLINIITLFFLYNKIYIKKIRFISILKKKMTFVLCLIILTISVFCYFSYNYIDKNDLSFNKTSLFNTQELYDINDVNKIDISIINAISSPTNGTPYNNWCISCTVYTKNSEYILESDGFYDYQYLFDYLSNIDCDICIDKNNYNDLYQYELNRPFLSKEKKLDNVKYLSLIFNNN